MTKNSDTEDVEALIIEMLETCLDEFEAGIDDLHT